ncbi:unnamed protein product [Spirodela intermedia]|uniref:Uncharacterized protein n=1 Tax=Spirodela intermedia TaxID=51605 RepID=A0A7I8KGV3_SPIIN|nr:unnamed protein product [Spirodela intermedia]
MAYFYPYHCLLHMRQWPKKDEDSIYECPNSPSSR